MSEDYLFPLIHFVTMSNNSSQRFLNGRNIFSLLPGLVFLNWTVTMVKGNFLHSRNYFFSSLWEMANALNL